MSNSEVSVKFTAEDAALWNAIQRQIAAQKRLGDGVDDTKLKASAASRELDRFAESTRRIIATPVERYDAAITKLDAALAANKLTEEEHSRAVAQAKATRDAATKAADGTALAEARVAAELDRVAANAKKIITTPVQEFQAEVLKLKAAMESGRLTQDEYNAAVAKHEAVLEAARKAADGTAAAEARAAAELDRVAANAKKIIATPVQEFQAEVQRLKAAMESGRLTQDEYNAAVAKHEAVLEAARKAADGTAAAEARAAAELDRVAANAKKMIATPVQEFQAEVQRLKAAMESGRLTQDEYNAAVAKHEAVLDAARKAADGTAAAEARAASEMDQFTASAKKLSVTPLQEYERTLKLAKKALDEGRISQQEFNRVQTDAKAKYDASAAGLSDYGRQALGAGRSSGSLVSSVTSLAAGYVSLQTAISLTNQYLTENVKKSEEALAAQTKLAASHETTIQNLTGLSSANKRLILTVEAPKIQARTGFPDQAKLVEAIGANYSSSGDLSASLDAAESASRITLQNPNALPQVAAGALDIGQASGVTDSRKTLGMALNLGAVSRVEDPHRVPQMVAPVIRTATANVPDNLKEEAARQAAGIWALATKRANDLQGDSSRTASTTLLSKMDTFFRSKQQQFEDVQNKKASGLALTQQESQTLIEGPFKDPLLPLARLDMFRKNKNMQRELLGKEGFGEDRFKTLINQLVSGEDQTISELEKYVSQIQFDASVYERAAKQAETATPQLVVSTAKARSEALKQLHDLQNDTGAMAAQVRASTSDVLQRTRSSGLNGAFQFLEELNTSYWNFIMTSDADAVDVSDEHLLRRRNDLLQQEMLPGFSDPSYGAQWDKLQSMKKVGVERSGHLTETDLTRAGLVNPEVINQIMLIEQQLQVNERIRSAGNERQKLENQERVSNQPQQITVPRPPIATIPGTSVSVPFAPAAQLPPVPAAIPQLPPAAPPPKAAGVSPETNQAAAVGSAGENLVAALEGLARQVRAITVRPPEQVAVRPRPQIQPDYTGRARREQAFATG